MPRICRRRRSSSFEIMPAITSIFGSPGAQAVVASMTPDNRVAAGSRILAPADVWPADLRVSDAETIHQWFRRVIGTRNVDEAIARCAVNNNFAFFGHLGWHDYRIDHCQFQALITAGSTLREFYDVPVEQVFYYRLDVDFTALGELFSHPHPHVHAITKEAPRFPFVCGHEEFVVVSFLEFVFLNHFHNSWLEWAERNATTEISEEAFEEIVFAFNRGDKVQLLPGLTAQIHRLKNALRRAKREEVPGVLPLAPLCELLTYP